MTDQTDTMVSVMTNLRETFLKMKSVSPLIAFRSDLTRLAAMTVLGISLAGCYESEVKVLNFGDDARIAGKYNCKTVDGSRPEESVTVSVRVTGSADKVDYEYSFSGGGKFRFSNLDSGMFFGQTRRAYQGWGRKEKDARFGYAFLDVKGPSGFSFYELNFDTQEAEIGRMMESHDVRFKNNPFGRTRTMTLTGSADNIFSFFNDHSRFMLRESVICSQRG